MTDKRVRIDRGDRIRALLGQSELDESEFAELCGLTGVVCGEDDQPLHNRMVGGQKVWATRDLVAHFSGGGGGVIRHRMVQTTYRR